MYKVTGYVIRTPNGDIQPQFFNTKVKATEVCQQNGLDPAACVIQLFRWEKFTPVVSEPLVKEQNDD